jgi:hypothetical protein
MCGENELLVRRLLNWTPGRTVHWSGAGWVWLQCSAVQWRNKCNFRNNSLKTHQNRFKTNRKWGGHLDAHYLLVLELFLKLHPWDRYVGHISNLNILNLENLLVRVNHPKYQCCISLFISLLPTRPPVRGGASGSGLSPELAGAAQGWAGRGPGAVLSGLRKNIFRVRPVLDSL